MYDGLGFCQFQVFKKALALVSGTDFQFAVIHTFTTAARYHGQPSTLSVWVWVVVAVSYMKCISVLARNLIVGLAVPQNMSTLPNWAIFEAVRLTSGAIGDCLERVCRGPPPSC